MLLQFRYEVPSRSTIPEQYILVSRSCSQHTRTPRQSPNPGLVSTQGSNLPNLVHIPELHLPTIASHRQQRTIGSPSNRSDYIILQLTQLRYFGVTRIPKINAAPQSNCQLISFPPFHQIQVEVVLQCGSIEHLARHPIHLPIANVLACSFKVKRRVVSCFSLEAFAAVLKDIAVFEGSEVLVIRSTLPPEHFLAVN